MIRFIATDLDGTLLDGQGALPEEIFSLALRLSEHGILFAPASGRQYANLKKLFLPVWKKLLFICENGALVKHGDETIYLNPLPVGTIKGALDAVRNADGLFPILCGEKNAYVENSEEPFYTRARTAYSNCIKVGDLDEYIETEPVCKISVFDQRGAESHAMRALPPLLGNASKLTLSGGHWCDISALTADKGEALIEIQKKFGFSREECMAFGDQMNDAGMLRVCTHSRAVENALPAIKKLAGKLVPSNADGGVLIALKELLAEIETKKGV